MCWIRKQGAGLRTGSLLLSVRVPAGRWPEPRLRERLLRNPFDRKLRGTSIFEGLANRVLGPLPYRGDFLLWDLDGLGFSRPKRRACFESGDLAQIWAVSPSHYCNR